MLFEEFISSPYNRTSRVVEPIDIARTKTYYYKVFHQAVMVLYKHGLVTNPSMFTQPDIVRALMTIGYRSFSYYGQLDTTPLGVRVSGMNSAVLDALITALDASRSMKFLDTFWSENNRGKFTRKLFLRLVSTNIIGNDKLGTAKEAFRLWQDDPNVTIIKVPWTVNRFRDVLAEAIQEGNLKPTNDVDWLTDPSRDLTTQSIFKREAKRLFDTIYLEYLLNIQHKDLARYAPKSIKSIKDSNTTQISVGVRESFEDIATRYGIDNVLGMDNWGVYINTNPGYLETYQTNYCYIDGVEAPQEVKMTGIGGDLLTERPYTYNGAPLVVDADSKYKYLYPIQSPINEGYDNEITFKENCPDSVGVVENGWTNYLAITKGK